MAMMPGRMSEHLAVVASLQADDPVVVVDTELFTDYVDMQDFEQVMFICSLGDVNAKTFTLVVYESILGAGTDVSLVAWASIAAHATTNDNTQYVCCVRREELSAGYRYVRAGIVSQAAQDGEVSLIGIAANPIHEPASGLDLTTVTIKQ
jgi:hypothetical protein